MFNEIFARLGKFSINELFCPRKGVDIIAVRRAIVNITSRETGNPFWMTDPTCFYDTSTFAKTKKLIDVELANVLRS